MRVSSSHELVLQAVRAGSAIAVIVIIGFLPVTWFKPGHFIAGGDFFPNFNPIGGELTYAWGKDGFGGPSLSTPLFSLEVFLSVFKFLGFGFSVAEMALFCVYFSLAGVSMYILADSVKHGNRFTSLCAALLYMFSFFSMASIWAIRYTDLLALPIYASIPLTLGLYIRGLKAKCGVPEAIAFATIASAIGLPSFSNPVYGFLILVLPTAYFVWFAAVKRKISRQHLLFTVTFLGQWVLVNAFWLLPDLYISRQFLNNPSIPLIGLTDLQIFRNLSAENLFETLRLSGIWTLRYTVNGDNLIPWGPIYYTPIFLAVGLLFPILAFGSLILEPKDKDMIFFAIVAAFSSIMMAGNNSSVGYWIVAFLSPTGIFAIFRSPWSRFGFLATVSYSYLIAKSLGLLSRTKSSSDQISSQDNDRRFRGVNRKHLFVGVLFILLIGVYPWPLWTGAIIPSAQPSIPSAQINVPQYYSDAANWLSSQSDEFYIMSLPIMKHPYIAFTWQSGEDGYLGVDPDYALLRKPILVYQQANIAEIASLISSNTTVGIPWFLSLMNVKYLLIHEDIDKFFTPEYSLDANVPSLERILDSTVGLKLEQVFGKLRFYRNQYWVPDKSVFGSSNVLVSGQKNDSLSANVIAEMSFLGVPAVMSASEASRMPLPYSFTQLSPEITRATLSANSPNITYTELDPTKYVVHVSSGSPFLLILAQSFHTDWKLCFTDGAGSCVPDKDHLMVNGLANAWYVMRTGKFTLTLTYSVQELLNIGEIISLIGLMTAFSVFLARFRKYRRVG